MAAGIGGRDEALGRDLRINGVLHTVIGVLPGSFRFVDPEIQLWTPVAFTPEQRADDERHSNNWQQIARLKPGSSIEQAQSQLHAINAANLERFPELPVLINAGFQTVVKPFHADLVETTGRTLYLLWGAVLCVLIIGCVNIANLVSVRRAYARASWRRATRARGELSAAVAADAHRDGATGTRWWHIGHRVGHVGVDGGGCSASISCPVATKSPWTAFPWRSPSPSFLPWAFWLACFRWRRCDARISLRAFVRKVDRARYHGATRLVRGALVTSHVAFALVPLVGAGLLLASFQRVLAVDPGFDPARLLTGSVSFPATRYADETAVR